VPAAWVTYESGRRAGLIIAILGGLAGFLSDVVPRYHHRGIEAWNVTLTLITLFVVVELVHLVQRQAAAALEAERQSREFLAFAAHQLRTPLAGIRSTVDALVLGADDEAERDILLVGLSREADRAGRLISSLLQLARIDQHEPLPFRPTNVGQMVGREVERAATIWPHLEWRTMGGGDSDTMCNPDALAEALINLLDNAHRHARTKVVVEVRDVGTDLDITVTDDGPGLPAGMTEVAFRRFVSLDGQRGSGLGLAIARGLAEAHGGTLTYAAGSFRMRLPRRANTMASAPAGRTGRPAAGGNAGVTPEGPPAPR
jgi:signal transduction histidine kinase